MKPFLLFTSILGLFLTAFIGTKPVKPIGLFDGKSLNGWQGETQNT